MSEKTASQVRYEQAVKDLTRERFMKHPKTLYEAIAKHYCAHAMIALEMANLIKHKRAYPPCSSDSDVDNLLDHLAETIKQNHIRDFGTELIDIVSKKAKAWDNYITELDGVE